MRDERQKLGLVHYCPEPIEPSKDWPKTLRTYDAERAWRDRKIRTLDQYIEILVGKP